MLFLFSVAQGVPNRTAFISRNKLVLSMAERVVKKDLTLYLPTTLAKRAIAS
jgi:hypothetical protein